MIIIDEDGIMHDVVPKKVLEQIRDEIQKASRCSAEPHGLLDTEVVMDIIDNYMK